MDHAAGGAADEKIVEGAVAVRAHDDELRIGPGGLLQDRRDGGPVRQGRLGLHAQALELLAPVLQAPFGLARLLLGEALALGGVFVYDRRRRHHMEQQHLCADAPCQGAGLRDHIGRRGGKVYRGEDVFHRIVWYHLGVGQATHGLRISVRSLHLLPGAMPNFVLQLAITA